MTLFAFLSKKSENFDISMIKPVIAMQSCDQRWILAMTNPPKNRLWLKTRPLKLKIAKCLCKTSLKFKSHTVGRDL